MKLFRKPLQPLVYGERMLRKNLTKMSDDELVRFRHCMLAWSGSAPHEDGALRIAIIDEEMQERGIS